MKRFDVLPNDRMSIEEKLLFNMQIQLDRIIELLTPKEAVRVTDAIDLTINDIAEKTFVCKYCNQSHTRSELSRCSIKHKKGVESNV